MKKTVISATFIVLTICGLYAQDVKFGVRGGMNLPNIMAGGNNTPLSEGYKSRLAAGWGIFTELQLNPDVSLRLGVEYSGLGGKKEGMQAMPTQRIITAVGSSLGIMGMSPEQELALGGLMMWSAANPYYYANVNNTVKFDYVMIPVMAQFGKNIGQTPWRAYVNAGQFVSFFISGKQVAKGTSAMYADASGTNTVWDVLPVQVQDAINDAFPTVSSTLSKPVVFGSTNISGEMKSTNFGVTGNVGLRY